jgi:hypothetical protein
LLRTELLHHGRDVEGVPTLHDLAAHDAEDADPTTSIRLPLVRIPMNSPRYVACDPAGRHFVPFGHHIFDGLDGVREATPSVQAGTVALSRGFPVSCGER